MFVPLVLWMAKNSEQLCRFNRTRFNIIHFESKHTSIIMACGALFTGLLEAIEPPLLTALCLIFSFLSSWTAVYPGGGGCYTRIGKNNFYFI